MVYKSIVYIVVACWSAYVQGNVIKTNTDLLQISQPLLNSFYLLLQFINLFPCFR